jgi:RNA-dependent RNA polymerase
MDNPLGIRSVDVNPRNRIRGGAYVLYRRSLYVSTVPLDPGRLIMIHLDSEDWTGPGNPPAEKIMTDGCGFINGAALLIISKHMNLPNRPAAVQGRIAGAKGLWCLNPYDRDPKDPPKIWIRKSQRKIDLGPFSQLDRSHRIFDLVAPSRTWTSGRLSMESIITLSHNGVPDDVFISLMREGLEDKIENLTNWTRPNAMAFLWHAIDNSGNVSGSRIQRHALGVSRALGLKGRDYGRQKEDVREDANDPDTGRTRYSGEPEGLHESALELVQAGFHPSECPILCDKMRMIVRLAIDNYIKDFHYPVDQSARAFIIPGMHPYIEQRCEGSLFLFRSLRCVKRRGNLFSLYRVIEKPGDG